MSKMKMLRSLITEKMTAAVKEILAAVESTVAGYELEVEALRRELTLTVNVTTQHTPVDQVVVKKPKKKGGKKMEKHDPQKTQELFRSVQTILDVLTPQTFQELMKQVSELSINTEERLKGVIDLIYEKAISEPDRAGAYANMCRCFQGLKVPATDSPGSTLNFRKLLLNRCRGEFEKKIDDEIVVENQKEPEAASSDEERQRVIEQLEEAKDEAQRRDIGNVTFLGELFKVKMLTEAHMHGWIVKLLKNHDEDSLECLCRLLSIIGKDLDLEKAKNRMDPYFNKMMKIIRERKTSSRIRFLLQDVVDLRQNNWLPRQDTKGPENVDQSHKEAEDQWEQIRIRDPNQGGRDITEEIMSRCSTLTLPQTPVLDSSKVMWEGSGNKPAETDSGNEPVTSTLNLTSSAASMDSDRKVPQRLPKDVDVSELVEVTPGDWSEMSSLELTNHLDRLIQGQADNQSIIDWTEANLDKKQTSSNMFVRTLMTCVCRSAIICEKPYRLNKDVIKQRVTLLQKFLEDEQKELQALYALQALMVQMEQPPNLLLMFFDFLYDEDLIKKEVFFYWESIKDPMEQRGKRIALKSVTDFFTRLREAEDDNS